MRIRSALRVTRRNGSRHTALETIALAKLGRSHPSVGSAPSETRDMREWARGLARRAVRLTAEWHGGGPPAAGPIDVIDLFCGCGGLSAGFEIVGRLVPSYRLPGAVDVDPRGTATYAANLPF